MVPLATSVCNCAVVRIGSLPENPPNAITGLPVAMIYGEAVIELVVAKR
jgi:hypothetical protein